MGFLHHMPDSLEAAFTLHAVSLTPESSVDKLIEDGDVFYDVIRSKNSRTPSSHERDLGLCSVLSER